jgi:chromosome segregation ATPase
MKTFRWSIALLVVPMLMLGCPEPREPAPPADEPFPEEERPVEPEQERDPWAEQEEYDERERAEVTDQQREQRQAYIDQTENRIDQLEQRIDQLEDRLGDAPEQVRTDIQPQLDALRDHVDVTRTRYEGWDEMTQQAFQETQSDVDRLLGEAENRYEEISQRVEQEVAAPPAAG